MRSAVDSMERRREYGGYRVTTFVGASSERLLFEQGLSRAGFTLALPHCHAWACSHPLERSWFVGVESADGKALCGFALQVSNSRTLPGHRLLRVERFGHALSLEAAEMALAGLADIARRDARTLRLHVEVFTRDAAVREAIAKAACGLGFRRPKTARSYTNTIAIDLTPPDGDIFAGFHGTARRHVRALEKKGFSVRPIDAPAYAKRMDALVAETMKRTSGRYVSGHWETEIVFAGREPSLSRLVGTFQSGLDGPDALLAFAWGCHHGAYASYSTAASTRSTRVALLYGPMWDLILWAKRNGAQWFDLGGVTLGTSGDDDRLGGISDFKRYFGGEVVSVGDEWVLEPNPVRATIANELTRLAGWLRAHIRPRP